MGWLSDAIGTLTGSNASRDAARMQTRAADRSIEVQRQIYDQQRADSAPFREVGLRSLAGLEEENLGLNPNDIGQNEAYQFRLQEGMRALGAGASARGAMGGGGRQRELLRYGQGMASQEYDKIYSRKFNRLSQLAGIGSGTQAQLMQATGNYGQAVSNSIMGAANASAAARMQGAASFTNLLGQGMTAGAIYGSRRKK